MPTPYTFIVEHDDRGISNTVAVAGPSTLIPSPGQNYRIVVTSFVVQNESQATTLIILQDNGSDRWQFYAASQGAYLSKDFSDAHPWKLRKNSPLTCWLGGANQFSYSIQYYIEKA